MQSGILENVRKQAGHAQPGSANNIHANTILSQNHDTIYTIMLKKGGANGLEIQCYG
jgi:hypothetical protein